MKCSHFFKKVFFIWIMYFYHLKFELYTISTSDQTKKETENIDSSDLYFVPKDIFEKLPSHQPNSDKNTQRTNNFIKSKTKSKARSKSLDLSKNFPPSEIPLIPPTPVSRSSS